MSTNDTAQQHDQAEARHIEFRIAMDALLKHLAIVNQAIFKWRHELAEHMKITPNDNAYAMELTLKHWLEHHSETGVIHSPQQFFHILRQHMEDFNNSQGD